MKNKADEILYVGKAISLKKRVASYFNHTKKDPKTRALVRKIHHVDFITTSNEIEALILENNLIKQHQPRFNIDLKNNEKYPFLKITKEPYPRLIVSRRRFKDGARYFGPYPNAGSIRRHIKVLQRIFPLRLCGKKLTGKKIDSPCLNYHMNRCSGACQGTITPEEYQKRYIDPIVLYLRGQYQQLMHELEKRMVEASKKLRFEEAATYRDQLKTVTTIAEKQRAHLERETNCDVVGFFQTDSYSFLAIMRVRDGKLLGKVTYSYEQDDEPAIILEQVLQEHYSRASEIPAEIVLPFIPDLEDPFKQFLERERNGSVRFTIPKSGPKHDLLTMACENARYTFQEKKKVTAKELVLMDLKTVLQLPTEPRRIEAFDVSNTEGLLSVTAMVCFTNAIPDKKNYRIFKIRGKDTPDDYAMLQEGLARHYQRVLNEDLPRPDLILIDGGKGQLNASKEVLDALGLAIPIISLAKKEEDIYVPNQPEPLPIPNDSKPARFLQEVRDEVHRFGITFHRKIRAKRLMWSQLDEIQGIGAVRKRALYKHFHSLKAIRRATREDLLAVEKMDERSTQAVLDFFAQKEIQ
jgi:excinuclease ABC subunit C